MKKEILGDKEGPDEETSSLSLSTKKKSFFHLLEAQIDQGSSQLVWPGNKKVLTWVMSMALFISDICIIPRSYQGSLRC